MFVKLFRVLVYLTGQQSPIGLHYLLLQLPNFLHFIYRGIESKLSLFY